VFGTIRNLKEGEYKLRIEDPNGRLIDEKVFSFGVELGDIDLSDNPKYCETKADCVAVDCGCSCSGCGGFSYQDVVNVKYEETWYELNDCEPNRVCLQVCCPRREIACEDNECTVIELEDAERRLEMPSMVQ
jgi:hypothetical protein